MAHEHQQQEQQQINKYNEKTKQNTKIGEKKSEHLYCILCYTGFTHTAQGVWQNSSRKIKALTPAQTHIKQQATHMHTLKMH